MINLKLIELTLAIDAFITVIIIIIIACITSTVIFHHSSALNSAYIIIIMNSTSLHATYRPLSTYNFAPSLFDASICMYVYMYVFLCKVGKYVYLYVNVYVSLPL